MAYRWKTIKQKVLPRSLYGRSLMIIVVPIMLIQIIVAYIFISQPWERVSNALVSSLSGEIRMVIGEIRMAPTNADVQKIIDMAGQNLGLQISIEGKREAARHAIFFDGITWYSVETKLQKYLQRTLSEPFTIVDHPKQRQFEVDVQIDHHRVVRFLSSDDRLMDPRMYIFILWLIGSSVFLMAVAVIFMRNQIRPIHRLALAAEKLGKGQDLATFKVEGAREVRQAGRAFLDMRDRIRRQIDQRTAMLAGVSHDLRTPLTRMKLQLAMQKDSAGSDELRQDLDEMEKMLEGYLAFARGSGNEPTELVDMRSVLARIAANARRQGADITENYVDHAPLRARPVAIERALGNIVSNACKYATHVRIGLTTEPEAVEITVDDDGPGIPVEQHAEVFKPFYRLEKSRNQKTGGVGLGLSIAQDIIHAHGGEVSLADSDMGGLRVIVRLPV